MMASFNVSSWNCRGINASTPVTTSKTDFLEAHFSINPVDILALLETHHTCMEDLPALFQGFAATHHLLHTPTQAPDTYGGMIVVIDKTKFDLIDYTIYLPGRILTAVLKHLSSQEEYVFTFYYGLQPGRSMVSKLQEAMHFLMQQHTDTSNSFIIGDFNFIDQPIDRPQGFNSSDNKVLPLWYQASVGLFPFPIPIAPYTHAGRFTPFICAVANAIAVSTASM